MTSTNRRNLPSITDATWYVVTEGRYPRKLPGAANSITAGKYYPCDSLASALELMDRLNTKWRANQRASDFERREYAARHNVIGVLDVQPHPDTGIDKGHTINPGFTRELYRDGDEERAEFAEIGRVRSWGERLAS